MDLVVFQLNRRRHYHVVGDNTVHLRREVACRGLDDVNTIDLANHASDGNFLRHGTLFDEVVTQLDVVKELRGNNSKPATRVFDTYLPQL